MNKLRDLNRKEIEEISIKICDLLDDENIKTYCALDVLMMTFSTYLASSAVSKKHLLQGIKIFKEECLIRYQTILDEDN
jgi:hypothetical protein